jgi:hypothetical protein
MLPLVIRVGTAKITGSGIIDQFWVVALATGE